MTWFEYLMPIASATLRSLALIAITTLLILALLPAALGAAASRASIAG